jgi:hypothetical protein
MIQRARPGRRNQYERNSPSRRGKLCAAPDCSRAGRNPGRRRACPGVEVFRAMMIPFSEAAPDSSRAGRNPGRRRACPGVEGLRAISVSSVRRCTESQERANGCFMKHRLARMCEFVSNYEQRLGRLLLGWAGAMVRSIRAPYDRHRVLTWGAT